MFITFAVRNVFRNKARSLFTILTIAFGCVGLIFVGGFFEDVFAQLQQTFINGNNGHLQVYKRGFSQFGRLEPYNYYFSNYREIEKLIQGLPEVKYVTPRIEFFGLLSTGDNTIAFLGQGVDPTYEQTIPYEVSSDFRNLYVNNKWNGLPAISEGVGLTPDDQYNLMLGSGLAKGIGVKPGATLILLANTIKGSTNALDIKVNGIFSTSYKDLDDIVLRLPLVTAKKLLNTDSVQSLVVKLHNNADTDRVRASLLDIFKSQHLEFEIKTWIELSDFYTKTVNLFGQFHLVMRIVVGLVLILGIFNTFSISVKERTSEIGTIMALGANRTSVLKLFLTEGFVIGVIGGIVGIVVGVIVVGSISSVGIVMPPAPGSNRTWLSHPAILFSDLVTTFIISVLASIAASFYPAYKASRLMIVNALRYRG